MEKIFANNAADKELITKIYKQLIQLNIKRNKQPHHPEAIAIMTSKLPSHVIYVKAYFPLETSPLFPSCSLHPNPSGPSIKSDGKTLVCIRKKRTANTTCY